MRLPFKRLELVIRLPSGPLDVHCTTTSHGVPGFHCAIYNHSSPVSGISWTEFLYPNFTASHYKFIDGGGSFLFSLNGSFKVAMSNPGTQQTRYYFCVIHVVSHNIIWSANRDAPVSNSANMILDFNGIKIIDEDGSLKWSTPSLKSSVSALKLTDTGNLILMDKFNGTLWESFQYPTDTILIGQNLPIGTSLSSAKTDDDLSTGDYKLLVTVSDAILQWQNQTYWQFSMATKAYTNSNYAVDYMAVNQTGLYLLGHNGSVVVIQLSLGQSNFRMAKLDASGQFKISSFSNTDELTDFAGPTDRCRIPFICGSVGLCTDDSQSGAPLCSCPSNFKAGSSKTTNCMPSDASHSLLASCNATSNRTQLNSSSLISYLRLGYGTDYFANDFNKPTKYGVDLTSCQDLCSRRCSCLGVFFGNSSGSCYQLENVLGSFRLSSSSDNDRLGFIKTLVGPTSRDGGDNGFSGQSSNFPIVALVLLPSTGFFLLVLLAFLWCRRSRLSTAGKGKIRRPSSPSEDIDAFSIMGLPMRFDYEELEKATNNFKTKIGAGFLYFPLFALDMHEEGRYLELADLRLEGRVTSEEVEKLVRVALCCVHEEPTLRPNMGSVVSMLEGEIPLCQPSLASLNFLRFYGRRFAESSAVEENSGKDSVALFPKAEKSRSRANSGSNTYFSYISSQQVSGPR
ncbi:Glycosyl transferase, family 51 [Heracleum sosnowskyi]|uniref:Glycosyl transferase, family 51 n=1 Tax=Heracleum sosnowskyi TaxID=360622 RepID=A0AAD8H8E9_9APIA|nr:Glycosyl transferase, family 51 [Heracleum sosnowskyi]